MVSASALSRRTAQRASGWALALGMAVATALPAEPALALDPGATGAAAATQAGWWNRLQGSMEGEPPGNPVRPLIPAFPAPPTVPGDAIAAGASGGQPDKVAAVGIEVAVPTAGHVDALTLRLTESPAQSANTNAATAKVLACPATVPWGANKNSSWVDRPKSDCGLGQAEGKRAADGTWTFDLTALAGLWADPVAPLAQYGVVLALDPAASPGVTQVSWLDVDTGKVAVDLLASGPTGPAPPAAPAESPSGGPTSAASPAPDGAMVAVPVAEGSGAARGSAELAFSDPLAFPTGQPVYAPISSPAVGSGTELSTAPDASVPVILSPARPLGRTLRARPVVGLGDEVPATTLLLVPIALGLALLIGLVLGPTGRPLPVWKRAGGLSRALDRREFGSGGATD
jgi:hypothetical protein